MRKFIHKRPHTVILSYVKCTEQANLIHKDRCMLVTAKGFQEEGGHVKEMTSIC